VEGKKMITVSKFDAADYLDDEETIAAYLSEALETAIPTTSLMPSTPLPEPRA
jgi:DNA-binding phage protein